MSTLGRIGGVVAAVLLWLGLAVLSSLDPADGATWSGTADAPCLNRAERTAIEPGTPREVVERTAHVEGVELRRLRDYLVHGVAYLSCSGRRVVVLYFLDDESVASVLAA